MPQFSRKTGATTYAARNRSNRVLMIVLLASVVIFVLYTFQSVGIEGDSTTLGLLNDPSLGADNRADRNLDLDDVEEADSDEENSVDVKSDAGMDHGEGDETSEQTTTEENEDEDEQETAEEKNTPHKVAGLSCENYGGPADDVAAEMVYWRDIPSDAKFVSPFKNSGPMEKYLTFEPDEGGWNNIRMSMETAVAMAYAMGRTLVMPPEQGMYLLEKSKNGQKNRFKFSDFFHFDSVAMEHASAIKVISFEEFLLREAMTGHLIDKETGEVSYPPDNRTHWDGEDRHSRRQLDLWTRTVTTNPIWDFDKCVVVFPKKPGPGFGEKLKATLSEVWNDGLSHQDRIASYNGKPTSVVAPPKDRFREIIAHRKEICLYDDYMQNAKVFHLMGDNDSGARLLVHFYAFLFFEDWRHDLWTKRFVRDHLRYVDEIQCAAARVVNALRELSKANGDGGIYDSFHIRRGDFQYKDTRVEAGVIFNNSRDVLKLNSTIYIATDERDKPFFEIFRKNYNVYFLDDFAHLLDGVNTNFYGMLDQRIASRGRTFVGTFYSTFTGYINRMRGYHSQLDKAEGYESGRINSYYYIPKRHKFDVQEYRSIWPPMWSREFPVGWRDLDHGFDMVPSPQMVQE